MSRAAKSLFLALWAVGSVVETQALESSNLDLVTLTTQRALGAALTDLRLSDEMANEAIHVESASTHSANWLVEHLLIENLLDRGLVVSRAEDGQTHLSWRVVDMSINGQSGLLGGTVERRCRVVLRLELRRHDELVWSGDGHAERQDRVPKGHIDALQHARFGFARTDLDERTWGKYIEPAIVTSVLGSLVYLFFSNR